jgi:hypothetical protein
MKSTFILSVLVGLTFSAVCSAQSPRSAVKVKYDKFEDLTEVSTTESKVDDAVGPKKEKQDLRLQARYFCAGNVSRCRPDKVELMFVSFSSGAHVRSQNLILMIDGKRIRKSKPVWSIGGDEAGRTVEHIDFAISMEDLLALAHAEKAEGKLEQTTFKLNDDALSAVRALASEMDSPMLRKTPKQ